MQLISSVSQLLSTSNLIPECQLTFLVNYKWSKVFFILLFQITRENYGMTEVKELIPGGEEISVDKDNRWVSVPVHQLQN